MNQLAVDPCFATLPMDHGQRYFVRSRLIIDMAKANKMFLTCEIVGNIMTHQAHALFAIQPKGRA